MAQSGDGPGQRHALITRDYNGLTFVFREDGYFNMTKAAKHFGKQLNHFLISPETDAYLDALSSSSKFDGLQKRHTGQRVGGNEYNHRTLAFIVTVPGNRYVADRGTWAHPKLAVFFAQWLDVKFAVWCDSVIEDILAGRAELTITKPEQSAVLQASLQLPAASRR